MLCINLLEFLVISVCLIERTLNVKARSLPKPENEESFSWFKQMQLLRHSFEECGKIKFNTNPPSPSSIWNCLKLAGIHLGENISLKTIIPLIPGVRLIKDPSTQIEDHINERIDQKFNSHEEDFKNITWFKRILWNVESLLSTHVLELNINAMAEYFKEIMKQDYGEGTSELNSSLTGVSGRHRRHRYNMLVTMFFGITALGAIVVPLGFQLLSLVSGKALLLAKMALLLASINALKWINNRGAHYGLYHLPGEHYGNVYDREYIERPRNVLNKH